MSERVFLNGAPVVGFGVGDPGVGAAPVASALPWGEIVASSVVSALAGLAIEEVVHSVRRKKRRR